MLSSIILLLALLIITRPKMILYALGLVVSIVTVNLYVGFTIYLSRILLICFFVVVLVQLSLGTRNGFFLRQDFTFIGLFGAILLVQTLSLFQKFNVAVALMSEEEKHGV